jgi:anti-sigma-K factor RskA
MNEHPQPEDFDLYALGVLDAEERQAIELHLKRCGECAQRLAESRGRIATLALTVPSETPPTGVKRQLMARVRESASAERSAALQSPAKTPRESGRWLPILWSKSAAAWAFAAVFAAIAIFFAVTSYRLSGTVENYRAEEASQHAAVSRANAILDLLNAKNTLGVTLTALPEKPQPTGRVLYHPKYGLLFYAQNLPSAPAHRVYQLWLVPVKGNPISAGVFEPDAKGVASIVLPPLPKGVAAKAFAVTIEPQGGVPQPTGPKVLVGAT